MSADGTTCHSRYIPVVTVCLGDMDRSVSGPHTDIVSVHH